ncbi:MAG TPA: hypothetical protein VFI38_14695 [Candidatus Acidoferrum sp.]|nr:hypothetical protein [Candidatus Acidoferrum sp.]
MGANMRIKLLVFTSSLLLFSNSSAGIPQNPSSTTTSSQTTVQRDSLATNAVQAAIVAQGSPAAIGAINNAIVQGTIVPAQSSTVDAGNFKWESDFTGSSYEFRSEMQIGGTTRVFATGHGNPAFYNGKTARPLFSHVAYASVPWHLPAIVLFRELNDPSRSLQFVGVTSINGSQVAHIRTQVTTGPIETELSVHDWYFNPSTGLPVRVEYRTPSTLDMRDNKPAAADFSNYQIINGIAVPFTIVASESGQVVSSATISSIAFNTSLAPSDFDLLVGSAQ